MDGEPIVLEPRRMRCRRLRRTITEAARLHEFHVQQESDRLGRPAYRKTFITLTYRKVGEWERCHISRMVRLMRQWFHRRGVACRFVWVAELQKRGALHYHLMVWVPRRLRLPRPDQCGWWPHGSTKIETARNPVGYMVKYATKTSPEDLFRLPKGVRLHGNGGHSDASRVALREALMPGWARQAAFVSRFLAANARRNVMIEAGELDPSDSLPCDSGMYYCPELRSCETGEVFPFPFAIPVDAPVLARCPGGGVVDLQTGEYTPSPWLASYEHGSLIITKKPEQTYERAA